MLEKIESQNKLLRYTRQNCQKHISNIIYFKIFFSPLSSYLEKLQCQNSAHKYDV